MNGKRKILRAVCLAAVACGAGCTTGGVFGRHGYANPESMNFVRADRTTLYDVELAVTELVEDMLSDMAFKEHYDLLAARKGERPLLQIGNIENYTGERVTQKLESARRRLAIALRQSRLFDVTDDAGSAESVSRTLAETLKANADAGLKGNEGLQHFGQHKTADCQMLGCYRSFRDGRRHVYELTLQLVDLATGEQVWSGLSAIAKE